MDAKTLKAVIACLFMLTFVVVSDWNHVNKMSNNIFVKRNSNIIVECIL
jgi:hypothetical protein